MLIENGYLIHLEKRDKNNNNVFYQELSFDQKVKLLLEYVNNFADTNTISDLSSNKLIIAKDTMELIHKHATEDRQLKTA